MESCTCYFILFGAVFPTQLRIWVWLSAAEQAMARLPGTPCRLLVCAETGEGKVREQKLPSVQVGMNFPVDFSGSKLSTLGVFSFFIYFFILVGNIDVSH